jgi:transcriptional regulator with XRE-family HTH domain
MPVDQRAVEDARKEYGERLKRVLRTLSLKQRTFASRLGFSPGYINDVLQGRTRPSLELLKALRTIFNISPNYLILGEGPMFVVPTEEEIGYKTPSTGEIPAVAEDESAEVALGSTEHGSTFLELTWLGHPWVNELLDRLPDGCCKYLAARPALRKQFDPCAAIILEELLRRDPEMPSEEAVQLALELKRGFIRLIEVAVRLWQAGKTKKLTYLFKTIDAF